MKKLNFIEVESMKNVCMVLQGINDVIDKFINSQSKKLNKY